MMHGKALIGARAAGATGDPDQKQAEQSVSRQSLNSHGVALSSGEDSRADDTHVGLQRINQKLAVQQFDSVGFQALLHERDRRLQRLPWN